MKFININNRLLILQNQNKQLPIELNSFIGGPVYTPFTFKMLQLVVNFFSTLYIMNQKL